MKRRRDPASPLRVREPVQVYLDPGDRARLERLRLQLAASKSDVLRRALEALERELSDPDTHPALRIIGLIGEESGTAETGDPARGHDALLADAEEASWGHPAPRGRTGGGGRRGR